MRSDFSLRTQIFTETINAYVYNTSINHEQETGDIRVYLEVVAAQEDKLRRTIDGHTYALFIAGNM